MNSFSETRPSYLKPAVLLGCIFFISFAYFYEGGGWNQNSRFDLLRALVERHTFRIDAYQANTQDKAIFRGHYYSDKAPGVVFLSLPFALATRHALSATNIAPESPRGEMALSYFGSIFSIALPTALAGVCLFFLGLRFSNNVNAAAFAAIALCLGTPIWAYATIFWAHALVGACLLFAFASALKLGDSVHAHQQIFWALAVGLTAGWATVTEYPAAPASLLLAILALWQIWPRGPAARWRALVFGGIGSAICAAILLWYLHHVFGSFRPSYSYYSPSSFSFMQHQGYLGLTYPHPDRLLKLLFGCSRGLFIASPISIAAPFGLLWLWKSSKYRVAILIAALIPIYYFLFNASFYWWKSGLTFGPRYAGASLPLLFVGVAALWQCVTPPWCRTLLALAICSIFIALMAVSTSSELSMQESCPLIHDVWPAFWSGHMALNHDSMLTAAETASSPQYGAFNLGQLLGLRGLPSLFPLFIVWTAAALLWRKIIPQKSQ